MLQDGREYILTKLDQLGSTPLEYDLCLNLVAGPNCFDPKRGSTKVMNPTINPRVDPLERFLLVASRGFNPGGPWLKSKSIRSELAFQSPENDVLLELLCRWFGTHDLTHDDNTTETTSRIGCHTPVFVQGSLETEYFQRRAKTLTDPGNQFPGG
jgi:hypothetical protein